MSFNQLILTSVDIISTKCANNALSWFLECQIDFMSGDFIFNLLRTFFIKKSLLSRMTENRHWSVWSILFLSYRHHIRGCPVSPCLLVSLRMAGHNFMNITFVAQILTSLLFVHRFVFCRLAHFYALSLSLHFMFHIYQKLSLRSLLLFDIWGLLWWAS